MARWLVTLGTHAPDRKSVEAQSRRLAAAGFDVVRIQSEASAKIETEERQIARRKRDPSDDGPG